MRVTGILRLPPRSGTDTFDRVRVSIRDVTEMGGPAPTVAEVELPGISVPDTGVDLPFEIDAELDARRTYAVRAHADRNGSGAVEPGDLVSTTAHVVDSATARDFVVPLKAVGG